MNCCNTSCQVVWAFGEAAATWWSHGRHLWELGQLYGKDGVHFANMKPYYKSVRGCVLKSVDWALENLNRPTGRV